MLERNLVNVEFMGRLLAYVLVFVNFSYGEWGSFLKHCISLNKLLSICTGGEPFRDVNLIRNLANIQDWLYPKMHLGKAPRQRCFGIKFTAHEDPYQGENQWSLGTCQTFSQCYRLIRHENIYVVKKKLNQIHIPKLWEHTGLTFMKINTSKSMWLRTRWFYFIVVDKFWNLIAPISWWFSTRGKELWVGMVHHSFSCDGSWVLFITQFHLML